MSCPHARWRLLQLRGNTFLHLLNFWRTLVLSRTNHAHISCLSIWNMNIHTNLDYCIVSYSKCHIALYFMSHYTIIWYVTAIHQILSCLFILFIHLLRSQSGKCPIRFALRKNWDIVPNLPLQSHHRLMQALRTTGGSTTGQRWRSPLPNSMVFIGKMVVPLGWYPLLKGSLQGLNSWGKKRFHKLYT